MFGQGQPRILIADRGEGTNQSFRGWRENMNHSRSSVASATGRESWVSTLQLATQEVYELMLGYELEVAAEPPPHDGLNITAMVGLAGQLCGLLRIRCKAKSACRMASRMLGLTAEEGGAETFDAVGEICNLVAGNFDSGSATLRASAYPALDRIAAILALRTCRLRIEGHTDNVPIHTAQIASNWELSTARSTELVRLLIERYRFAPERLSAAGYAQFHPLASNDTPQGRAQNRRVDLVILSEHIVRRDITADGSAKPSAAVR